MEKFSAFADHTTGINPFMPPQDAVQITTGRVLIGIPLALLRALPVLICSVLFIILNVLTIATSCVPGVAWVMQSVILSSTTRMLCVLLSCYNPQSITPRASKVTLPLPKGSRLTAAQLAKASNAAPSAGQIIVAPSTSPLDVLVWTALHGASFLCVQHGGSRLAHMSPLRALLHACSTSTPGADTPSSVAVAPNGVEQAVASARRSNGGPVVLFAQGARTNGKGVLQLAPVALAVARVLADQSGEPVRVGTCTVSDHAVHTLGGGWSALVRCVLAPRTHALVHLLPQVLTPQPSQYGQTKPAADEWAAAVRAGWCAVVRAIKPVNKSAADAAEFLAAWERGAGKAKEL